MWVSDWNEYFTAFNHCHCQSDGASGCVTWVIKDAGTHAHARAHASLRGCVCVCVRQETGRTNESKLDLLIVKQWEKIETLGWILSLSGCNLTKAFFVKLGGRKGSSKLVTPVFRPGHTCCSLTVALSQSVSDHKTVKTQAAARPQHRSHIYFDGMIYYQYNFLLSRCK